MRLSCNGCRVLRKGCSENCSIRPCLQWIRSPESQANATLFLAKFYGRAGLINLINAGPQHLRPAIFRSLLYEACGRIVNPIYGCVGLLWSGSWQLCQAAVEAVLMGRPITPITSEAAASSQGPPLKAHDIRHVSKDENLAPSKSPKKVAKTRSRFKRSKPKPKKASTGSDRGSLCCAASAAGEVVKRAGSHESSLSHESEARKAVEVESKENESMISGETTETSMFFRDEPEPMAEPNERPDDGGSDVGLELTLGFEPVSRVNHVIPVKKRRLGIDFEFHS